MPIKKNARAKHTARKSTNSPARPNSSKRLKPEQSNLNNNILRSITRSASSSPECRFYDVYTNSGDDTSEIFQLGQVVEVVEEVKMVNGTTRSAETARKSIPSPSVSNAVLEDLIKKVSNLEKREQEREEKQEQEYCEKMQKLDNILSIGKKVLERYEWIGSTSCNFDRVISLLEKQSKEAAFAEAKAEEDKDEIVRAADEAAERARIEVERALQSKAREAARARSEKEEHLEAIRMFRLLQDSLTKNGNPWNTTKNDSWNPWA